MDIAAALGEYGNQYPQEADVVERFLAVHAGDRGKAGLSPAEQRGHITASAWVMNYDRTKVLLTHHAKLNRWFQLGGHVEEGESVEEAALREAREESGLESVCFAEKGIFDIDAHLIPGRGNQEEHFHFDIRFFFQADDSESLGISFESRDLRWVTPEEAGELNGSDSMGRMVTKAALMAPNVFGEILPGADYVPRQGAYGLMANNKKELLLVRLPDGAHFLPGGGIEKGEDHRQALEREFIEETGLIVRTGEFLGTSVQYVMVRRHKRYYKIIGHMYLCELVGGNPNSRIEDDHEPVWVSLDRAVDTMAMENQIWAVDKVRTLIGFKGDKVENVPVEESPVGNL